MTYDEKTKKLNTLPWQALFDISVKKGIEEKEVKNKDKSEVIKSIILYNILNDDEIDSLVNEYIYGDRVTFTLWNFKKELKKSDYEKIKKMENDIYSNIPVSKFRKVKIVKVEEVSNRLEIIYIYSKEYAFVNESGKNDVIWEQHRGCIWIGTNRDYLASISKHEKMSKYIISEIGELLENTITQIKPPKAAVKRCVNSDVISRIVLQGSQGEKTTISRAEGFTEEQRNEMARIKEDRVDTSGSYIADITEDISATIKYNVNKGSIGIYKHVSASVLFKWTQNAIDIIFEEIKNLKGKRAEEIFKEIGEEIRWPSVPSNEYESLNWILTQAIIVLDEEKKEVQIPEKYKFILEKDEYFIKLLKVYCDKCDSYETPYCTNCGRKLNVHAGKIQTCTCGAPTQIRCVEGHRDCRVLYWYIPTQKLISWVSRNVSKIYKEYQLNYKAYIIDDMLFISNAEEKDIDTEILFDDIECFKFGEAKNSDRIKAYLVNLKEKCNRTCSKKKIMDCLVRKDMVCIPRLFYDIVEQYRPQPHKGGEYGDVSGVIKVGKRLFDFKGIAKKNSVSAKKTNEEKMQSVLLSTAKEGEEIIRQFVEQGMIDSRSEVIAIIIPQYIDADFKATLRFLAKIAKKKIVFIELDQLAQIAEHNKTINWEAI